MRIELGGWFEFEVGVTSAYLRAGSRDVFIRREGMRAVIE